ncbi:hypothetical protein BDV93DRAFT_529177 [Ceratobasidium sp. AG-I]|nr:hypothetical protein BDV93DRAFT_529177 [Ceratobasidium sp. AG-I]
MSHLETQTTDSPPLFTTTLEEPRLPSYSQSSPPQAAIPQFEHTYTLNKGVFWLTLKLRSYASSTGSLPVYHDGDLGVVAGDLSINSSELGKIKSITAVLSGERTVVGQDQSPSFLSMRKELWNSSMGASSGPWPIRFELPNEVDVKDYGVQRERFKLPPSFSVKGVPSFIEYQISIEVKRGRFRLNSQLDTKFTYITRSFSPNIRKRIGLNLDHLSRFAPFRGSRHFPPFLIPCVVIRTGLVRAPRFRRFREPL